MDHRLLVIPALGAALLSAVSPAPAATPAATGTVTVTASGAAAKELRRAGVRLQAPRARVATLVDGSTRLTFTPTSRTTAGGRATVPLRGELRFRRGTRTVRFTGLRLDARTASVTLTGRGANGRRVTLLRGAPSRLAVLVDARRRAVTVRPTGTRLTPATVRALRVGLRLRPRLSGTFGPVAAQAGPRAGTGTGDTTGTGATPPAGGGTPTAQPQSTEPVALARPATANDVVSATVVWRVRESFIRYINAGQGTTVRDGATADPAENLPDAGVPLVYQFRFPFRGGWSDGASDTAAVTFSGGVRFRYSAHTIDFATADPEIELNGPASRAIFRLTGSDGTPFTGKRAVLLDLRPSAAASRTVSPDGRTVTYDRIPAVIPAGTGDSVFAGFYLAGMPFGSVSLTYTTT